MSGGGSKQGEHAGIAVDAISGDLAICIEADERDLAERGLHQFDFLIGGSNRFGPRAQHDT